MDATHIISLIIAAIGGGGLSAWFTLRTANRKTKAEAHSIDVSALCKALDALQERVDQQDKKITTQDAKITALSTALEAAKKRITELEALKTRYEEILRRNNIDPCTGKAHNRL